ncbi:MAG: hypothetical protein NTV86_13300 [Planctomycetota bacterium]|nr:hypothetical protein [Planctomycetota bacterium]
MSFIDFLANASGGDPKLNLIKALAKERIGGNALLRMQFGSSDVVDEWSDMELLALPEGTIVTIVETYYALKKQGLSDREVFARIEAFRSAPGMPLGAYLPDLNPYIKYRVFLEHSHGLPPDVDTCIARARAVFGK